MDQSKESLLARLNRGAHGDGGADDDPWAMLAATEPSHDTTTDENQAADEPTSGSADGSQEAGKDAKLDGLLDRISNLVNLTSSDPDTPFVAPPAASEHEPTNEVESFTPSEPVSLEAAGLTAGEVEGLALKYLLARGSVTGRDIAVQIKLPFILVDELLRKMKVDRLVGYRNSSQVNDYFYELSDIGRERARRLAEHCTYFGAAPVDLQDYTESVALQSLTLQQPTVADVERAFSDLLINQKMFRTLGPAINSGRGMFLFGAPGNGKTSIAERVTKVFGTHIWIPRAIGVDGEIIRIFDPSNHEEVPIDDHDGFLDQRKIDNRWVRVRRPTIVAGGELTMDNLEVTVNKVTGISEAPLQVKSNCGTLVIDDFGRQRMSIAKLLNRWILPLEKRVDFLNLPNGKKVEVPFDELIVFSTNLEPRDLVDDAFLRRIPYKIEITDPTEAEFRELFRMVAPQIGFEIDEELVEYLIREHFEKTGRPFRCCHPRDLLLQIKSFCNYQRHQLVMTQEYFDLAVENYFAIT